MATSLRTALSEDRASRIPLAAVRPSVAGVWALGRIEARRLLLHPSYLIGSAFGLLLLRGAVGLGSGNAGLIANLAWLTGGLLVGMLVGTVLSANIAALRPRRDRTRELFGALPAPPEARTAGALAGLLLGPVAVSILLTAAAAVILKQDEEEVETATIVWSAGVDLFLVAQVPLTVAALGTIGIAVGRWVPTVLGGPVVIAAHVFTPIFWAVPWILLSESGVDRSRHMIYLAGAIAMWIALAFARDRRTAPRFLIAAGALALGIVAAAQQVPPGGW